MPTGKRIDWAAIRAEYIAGGISQRKLAAKYGVSFNTLKQKANVEKWADLRNDTYNKSTKKAQQKAADTVASNAVKLERARGLAIDKLIKALEAMPEAGGTHTRQYIQTGNKRMTVDYSLLDIVNALEKLTRNDSNDAAGGEMLASIMDVLSRRRDEHD